MHVSIFCETSEVTPEPLLVPFHPHTLVLLQPNLNAASCANSSPKPSMRPLTNGKTRLMAAPRNILQNVGGEYRIMGEDESDGGSSDSLELEWFAS